METRLCRICGKLGQNYGHIFRTEGLRNKIETCLPVVISPHTLLPDTICPQCTDQVHNFYTFIKNCLQNIIILETQYDITESCLRTKRRHDKSCMVDLTTPPQKNSDKNVQTDDYLEVLLRTNEELRLEMGAVGTTWLMEAQHSSSERGMGYISGGAGSNRPLVDYEITDSDDASSSEGNNEPPLLPQSKPPGILDALLRDSSKRQRYFDDDNDVIDIGCGLEKIEENCDNTAKNDLIEEIAQRRGRKRTFAEGELLLADDGGEEDNNNENEAVVGHLGRRPRCPNKMYKFDVAYCKTTYRRRKTRHPQKIEPLTTTILLTTDNIENDMDKMEVENEVEIGGANVKLETEGLLEVDNLERLCHDIDAPEPATTTPQLVEIDGEFPLQQSLSEIMVPQQADLPQLVPSACGPSPPPSSMINTESHQQQQDVQCLLCDERFCGPSSLASHVFETHGIDNMMQQILASNNDLVEAGATTNIDENNGEDGGNVASIEEGSGGGNGGAAAVVVVGAGGSSNGDRKKKLPNLLKISDLKRGDSVDDTFPAHCEDPPTLFPTFVCVFCPAVFTARPDLFTHLRVKHSDQSGFLCGICLCQANTLANLQSHVEMCQQQHPPVSKYLCGVCRYGEDNFKSLENHILVHNFLLETCRKQTKMFDPADYIETNDTTYDNVLMMSSSVSPVSNKNSPLHCSECGQNDFDTFKDFSAHRRSQHSSFHCDLCNKKYGRGSHLWKHVNRVHKGHPSVTCQLCYKTSASKYHLAQHFNKIHAAKSSITTTLYNNGSNGGGGSNNSSNTNCNTIKQESNLTGATTPVITTTAVTAAGGDSTNGKNSMEDFMSQKFQAFDFQSVKQSFMRQALLDKQKLEQLEQHLGQMGDLNAVKSDNDGLILGLGEIAATTVDEHSDNKILSESDDSDEELAAAQKNKHDWPPECAPKEIDHTSDLYTNIITNYTPPPNEGEFKCPKCGKGFHKRTLVKKHKKNCRPRMQKDLLTRCKSCARIFKDRQSLAKHLINYHYEYACEICGEKVQSKCEIVSHIRFSHPGGHLFCSICGNILRSRADLAEHTRTHLESYICHFCGDSLPSKIKLKMHILSLHRKILSLSCGVCLKLFETQHVLRDHVRLVHRDEMSPFTSCPVCGKNYGSKWKTYDHLNKSHGRIFRACKVCLEVFDTEFQLQTHYEAAHPSIGSGTATSAAKNDSSQQPMKNGCSSNGASQQQQQQQQRVTSSSLTRRSRGSNGVVATSSSTNGNSNGGSASAADGGDSDVSGGEAEDDDDESDNDNDNENDNENDQSEQSDDSYTEDEDESQPAAVATAPLTETVPTTAPSISNILDPARDGKISLLEKRLLGKKITDEDKIKALPTSAAPSQLFAVNPQTVQRHLFHNNNNGDANSNKKKDGGLSPVPAALLPWQQQTNDPAELDNQSPTGNVTNNNSNNGNPVQNSSKRTVYVNSNDPSFCEICHKTWPAKKHLWQHYIRCHKSVAATVCGICLKTNDTYAILQLHLRQTHPTLLHGQGFGSNFICRICGRYHNASSKLKLHMAIHDNFDWTILEEQTMLPTNQQQQKSNNSDQSQAARQGQTSVATSNGYVDDNGDDDDEDFNVGEEQDGDFASDQDGGRAQDDSTDSSYQANKNQNGGQDFVVMSNDFNYESLIEQVECSSSSDDESDNDVTVQEPAPQQPTVTVGNQPDSNNSDDQSSDNDADESDENQDGDDSDSSCHSTRENVPENPGTLESGDRQISTITDENRRLNATKPNEEPQECCSDNNNSTSTESDEEDSSTSTTSTNSAGKSEQDTDNSSASSTNVDGKKSTGSNMVFRYDPQQLHSAIQSIKFDYVEEKVEADITEQYCKLEPRRISENEIESAVGSIL